MMSKLPAYVTVTDALVDEFGSTSFLIQDAIDKILVKLANFDELDVVIAVSEVIALEHELHEWRLNQSRLDKSWKTYQKAFKVRVNGISSRS